jgi:cell division protein FtsZ
MHVKPEIERFAKIRVIGVGGAGGNVINSMIESQQINGVEFIAVNTDAQDLSVNKAFVKIPIGQELTNGLGAGADPEIGRKAAEESIEVIKQNLDGADMVFVTAGMGGGTGTGASPVIAAVAKQLGALTIGVVTKPFNFEGAQRSRNAENGIDQLKREVDALITIPNQKLLEIADDNMSIIDAFKMSDSVLNQGVQGISDLIVMPGLINVDFADVRTIMKDAGTALMGIGIGTGENRAETAARAAISSPLLEQSIKGATGILFNVIGGPDVTMKEVDKAATIIKEVAAVEANIIFGTTIDEKYSGQIKITVIATGFDTSDVKTQLGMSAYGSRVQVTQPERIQPDRPVAEPLPEEKKEPEKKKDPWKPDNYDGEFESKYDIPAFLRGK